MIALLLVGLTVLACLLLARHYRQRTFSDPTCAQCDYIVVGLPGCTCPECGADLSRSGAVRPPRQRKLMHRGILFVVVALFTIVATSILTPIIVRHLPVFSAYYQRVDLVPKSGAFVNVSILHSEDGFEPTPLGVIKIVIDPPSRVLAIIEVDPKTMMAKYPGIGWKPSAGTFSASVIRTVFATTGISAGPTSPEANDIVNGVNGIIQRMPLSWGTSWSSVGGWSRTTRYTPRWYWTACYSAFAAIGLATFLWLARRRRISSIEPVPAQSSRAA